MTPLKTHPWLLGVLILATPSHVIAQHAALRGHGGANLTPTLTPTDWSAPGVPRDSSNASEPVTITPALGGNTATTWFSWATFQDSPGALPPWSSKIFIDGEDINTLFEVDGTTPGFHGDLNRGPFTVRGGRHTLTIVADPDQNVAEVDESDNTWSGQFVWSPLELGEDIPAERSAPPNAGALALPNADGFIANRYPVNAWAIGLVPRGVNDNYDLHVYDDYTSSTSGFSVLRKASAWGAGETDFVVGHFFQTPYVVYPAAIRAQAVDSASFAIEHDGARNREGGTTQSFLSQTLAGGEILDVFEAELWSGTSYFFTLQTLGGPADLEFEIFPATYGGTYARGEGLESWSYDGSTRLQVYVPASSGWHPIVVYRPTGANLDTAVSYDLHWNSGSYADVEPDAADDFALSLAPPAPNPMHGSTRLAFVLPRSTVVDLAIYDVAGRRVSSLIHGERPAGSHSVAWNGMSRRGERLEAGVYIVRLAADDRVMTRRLAVLP